MKLVNCTHHSITLLVGGRALEIPASGRVARVSTGVSEISVIEVEGATIPLYHLRTGAVSGLPPAQEGVLHIVSLPTVLALAATRPDVVAIHGTQRDQDGRVIGAQSLARPDVSREG